MSAPPKLIADFHALHRLLMPRHPPYALSNLTTEILNSVKIPMRQAPGLAFALWNALIEIGPADPIPSDLNKQAADIGLLVQRRVQCRTLGPDIALRCLFPINPIVKDQFPCQPSGSQRAKYCKTGGKPRQSQSQNYLARTDRDSHCLQVLGIRLAVPTEERESSRFPAAARPNRKH